MKRNRIIDRIIDGGLIIRGSYIIVGFSGGPDSLCLLHALAQLQDVLDLTVIPVHINHNLRPEADEEEARCIEIAERMGLECCSFSLDCRQAAKEMGISTEEAGRRIRYEIFDEVAEDIREQLEDSKDAASLIRIALAHNADDQAETVLFRLIRGTGTHGLSGIPAYRASELGYLIVRPLLTVPRSEIEEYIRANNLKPNIDSSNSGDDYTRNRIRNNLIPYIEKNFNPSVKNALCRYAEIADDDDMILTAIALEQLKGAFTADDEKHRVEIDISVLKDSAMPIVSRGARQILEFMCMSGAAGHETISQISGLIYRGNASGSVDLPMGMRMHRIYDKLIITQAGDDIEIEPEADITIYPQIIMKTDYHPDDDEIYAAFDFDLFNEEHPGSLGLITVRTRREGDYIPMKNGNKKLQDYMVDAKIPRNARGSLMVAAIGSEILWVLPSGYMPEGRERDKGRFSQKYQISEDTRRILFIELGDDMC